MEAEIASLLLIRANLSDEFQCERQVGHRPTPRVWQLVLACCGLRLAFPHCVRGGKERNYLSGAARAREGKWQGV